MTDESVPEISKKQQQIVETAEELFLRHGVKRITIEEICQKAGVSKMTFYKYFADKIELVKYIWHTWLEESFKKLDEVEAMNIPFPEKLRLMVEYKQQIMSNMSTESIKDFIDLDFDHLEQGKIMPRFLQVITDAQKRGEIRPEILPEFLLVVLDKLYELDHDEDLLKQYPDYAAFNREVFNFFYYGVLTRPH